MFMHSHAYVPSILYLVISTAWDFSNCLPFFLSFPPSYVSCVMAPKHKFTPSRNPFHFGRSSSSSPSNPHPLMSGSVMRRLNWTSLRTFLDATFIQNAKSFCLTFLTLTYPLSSTVGVGSHYVVPQSRALP